MKENEMTVQQLIDELMKVEDREKTIAVISVDTTFLGKVVSTTEDKNEGGYLIIDVEEEPEV
jgi:hypothetical protein